MFYLKVVNGNLLNATEDYVAHQCNCTSTDAKGLADVLFRAYPHANSYKRRPPNSEAGSIDICGNGRNKRFVINMYAQFYPSGPRNSDNRKKRLEWFADCLDLIKVHTTGSVAMPYNIGCGLAGGDWDTYYEMLEDFADREEVRITLYRIV